MSRIRRDLPRPAIAPFKDAAPAASAQRATDGAASKLESVSLDDLPGVVAGLLAKSEPPPAGARTAADLRANASFTRTEKRKLDRARRSAFRDPDPVKACARWTRAVDGLLRAADARARESLGAPPAAHALLALGSYGRRELAPYSDIDYCIVVEHDTPEARTYFQSYAKKIDELIKGLGPHAPAPCTFLSPSGSAPTAMIDTPEGLASRLAGASADLAFRSARDRDYIQTALSSTRVAVEPGAAKKEESLHRRFLAAAASALGPPHPAIDTESPRWALVRNILRSIRSPFGVPDQVPDDWAAKSLFEPTKPMKAHVPLTPERSIAEGRINVKHDLLKSLQIPIFALRVLYGIDETNTPAVLDELVRRELIDPHLAERLKETVAGCLALRSANHLSLEKAEEKLAIVGEAERRAVRRMVPILVRLRQAIDHLEDPRTFSLR